MRARSSPIAAAVTAAVLGRPICTRPNTCSFTDVRPTALPVGLDFGRHLKRVSSSNVVHPRPPGAFTSFRQTLRRGWRGAVALAGDTADAGTGQVGDGRKILPAFCGPMGQGTRTGYSLSSRRRALSMAAGLPKATWWRRSASRTLSRSPQWPGPILGPRFRKRGDCGARFRWRSSWKCCGQAPHSCEAGVAAAGESALCHYPRLSQAVSGVRLMSKLRRKSG